jgi:hypothetical protein
MSRTLSIVLTGALVAVLSTQPAKAADPVPPAAPVHATPATTAVKSGTTGAVPKTVNLGKNSVPANKIGSNSGDRAIPHVSPPGPKPPKDEALEGAALKAKATQ